MASNKSENELPLDGQSKSAEVEVTQPKNPRVASLRSLFEKAKPSIAAVLPKHLSADRLLKIALVAASRNPTLLQCTPESILQSVMTAAQLGLDCGGVLGSAYLVPYRNQKQGGRYEAQFIAGYRGFIDLARRSGQIASIEAHPVYDSDIFEIRFGTDSAIIHKPSMTGERGQLVAVYAVAKLKDGAVQCEVMTKPDVDRIRARSRASSSGPWESDYDEMARKTVVRRLCKYLPLSPEMAATMAAEAAAEDGVDVNMAVSAAMPDFQTIPEQIEGGDVSASTAEKIKGKIAGQREPGDESEE